MNWLNLEYQLLYAQAYTNNSHLSDIEPSNLTVERDSITKAAVTLSWKGPNLPDTSIIGYEVQYRKSGEALFIKKECSLTCRCEVTGLTAYTKYEFKVAAICSTGCGPFTDVVTQFTSKFSMEMFYL